MSQEASVEMPRYECHKKVWALQINKAERVKVQYAEGCDGQESCPDVILHFDESSGAAPRKVEYSVVSRYWPKEGDYFVLYEDGYQSISPKKAFEEGYTRVR
jgi:hypothetical protein